MKKKIMTLTLSLLIVGSCSLPVFAADINANEKILLQYGYNTDIINAMEPRYKADLIEALQNDPEKVEMTTVVMEVDNLSEIEAFVSATDEELLRAGADQSDIDRNREKIEQIRNQSDLELSNEYGFSNTETKLIKRAIEHGENKTKVVNKEGVSTSGTLTSSTMTFTSTTRHESYNPTKYWFNCTYNWNTKYIMDLFSDKIGISWGGRLHEIENLAYANYYEGLDNNWTLYSHQKNMVLADESPDNYLLYEFPQRSGLCKTKTGSASIYLSNEARKGERTYIIARYGHQKVSSNGLGVTWGWPAVTFGTAYDQTPVENGRIEITY